MKNPPSADNLTDNQKGPLAEVIRHLDQISRQHPATRLVVDMARDAVQEARQQMAALAKKARQAQRKRRRQRDHVHELFDALASVPVPSWSLPQTPPSQDDALALYRQLREQTLPQFAQELQTAANRAEARDYLLLLSDHVLRRGQRMLIEGLVHHPKTSREALIERARAPLAGQFQKMLAKQAGYRLSQELSRATDTVLRKALTLLDVLLHTSPSLRLFWTEPDTPFDASRHERSKSSSEPRLVRATLMPGLWMPVEGRVLERAIVATRRVDGAADSTGR